jgi:hypothetical protein
METITAAVQAATQSAAPTAADLVSKITAGSLGERAMLVKLSRRCWEPSRVSGDLAKQLAAQLGIDPSQVKVGQYLIDPNTPSFAALLTARGKLRNEHYSLTLPWAHNGVRILSAPLFAQYAEKHRTNLHEFQAAAEAFASEYPRLVQLAIANWKGLLTLSDFPDDIRRLIGVRHDVLPIPQMPGDFRIEMSESQANALKADMQAALDAQCRDALLASVREPYQRLFKHLTRMIERLKADKANGKSQRFNDSLVDGLRELCDALPALNIANDPTLAELGKAAQLMIAGISAEQLRQGADLRQRVATEAQGIVDRIAPIVASAPPALTSTGDAVMAEAGAVQGAMRGFSLDF